MKISLISTDNCIVAHGLRTISACLKSKGHKVNLIFLPLSRDDNNSNYRPDLLKDVVELTDGSDLVGLSSMAVSSHRAAQVAEAVKRSLSVPIMWGGVHATICPLECLEIADMVCIGEGEESVLELVDKFGSGSDYFHVPNFLFKNSGKIVKNELRPLKEELDEFPFPDYELDDQYILRGKKIVPARKYLESNPNQVHHGQILVHTARGCPYSCTFCSNRFFNDLYKGKGKIIRKRDLKKVMEEIGGLRKKFPEASSIWITDDTFFLRDLDELETFSKMYRSQIDIPFQCYGTPASIREDKLKVLLNGGLCRVIMGIQTGSESLNRNVYKRFESNESVLRAVQILNKYKNDMEYPIYQIIISNPYEKKEDLLETIKLLKQLPKPYFLEIFNLIFFPGAELYVKAVNDGLITNRREARFNLDYYADRKHLSLSKKNRYLNTLIYCLRGNALSSVIGIMPPSLIDLFVRKIDSRWAGLYQLLLLGIRRSREIYSKTSAVFPGPLKQAISNMARNIFVFVSRIRRVRRDLVK